MFQLCSFNQEKNNWDRRLYCKLVVIDTDYGGNEDSSTACHKSSSLIYIRVHKRCTGETNEILGNSYNERDFGLKLLFYYELWIYIRGEIMCQLKIDKRNFIF